MGCGTSQKDIRVVHEENVKPSTPKDESRTKNNHFVPKTLPVGSRVHVRGYVGTLKFLGPTKIGDGDWAGIELDKPHHQGNDGVFEKTKYFTCKEKHGLIVRPEAIVLLTEELDTDGLKRLPPETIVKIQCAVRRILAKIRLRNRLERSGNEKRIDSHVMNTPPEAEQSVNKLSDYLTRPFENNRDKAFAIYRWLCYNISYDVEGFFGRRKKTSCKAEDVLIHKSCVCAGYSNLYEALAKAAGLKIHQISGYAKGYGYKAGQRIEGVNHAWNALHIDNQWYLSDATWGSGVLGNDLLFQRIPNTYRFLMQPDYAINDHFPEDEKWQLLEEPISRKAFETSVVVSGPFYEMGVELLTHKHSHYNIDGDTIEIDFFCPGRKLILMAKLKDSSGRVFDDRERTQLRRCGINQVRLRAQFPVKGDYDINVYVNVEGKWTFGLRYHITANKGCGIDARGFPKLSNSFYDDGFDLISPLDNIETTNGRAELKVQCFNRRFRSVYANISGINGTEKHMLKNQAFSLCDKTDSGFTLTVDSPAKGTYLLRVFAKKIEKGENNPFVCEYYITNLENAKRPISGFPRLSDNFDTWGLNLVGPRENFITSDGKAMIKMKATETCDMDVSSIVLSANLRAQDGTDLNLLAHQTLFFTGTVDDNIFIKIDTPGAGLYLLNIFGSNNDRGNGVWLCSYFIYSTEKERRKAVGFPMLSDIFHSMGMKLIKPLENICSQDGKAKISFECPENFSEINGYIKKGKETIHGCCKTTSGGQNTLRNISVELPSQGLFKLNVFGKKDNEDVNIFLFCLFIYTEKGIEK